jgi:hypothetical protein
MRYKKPYYAIDASCFGSFVKLADLVQKLPRSMLLGTEIETSSTKFQYEIQCEELLESFGLTVTAIFPQAMAFQFATSTNLSNSKTE